MTQQKDMIKYTTFDDNPKNKTVCPATLTDCISFLSILVSEFIVSCSFSCKANTPVDRSLRRNVPDYRQPLNATEKKAGPIQSRFPLWTALEKERTAVQHFLVFTFFCQSRLLPELMLTKISFTIRVICRSYNTHTTRWKRSKNKIPFQQFCEIFINYTALRLKPSTSDTL